ncbi:MAG: hypothetical protein ACRDZM_12810 [Acidimicrobiia bacterium]
MPRRNRVDPWGDLHAVSDRGMFTGNRGCLVDDSEQVVHHHRGPLWITCLTEYRDWRVPLARPGRWTPIFFLDDAVALAAGHRPCGLCRHEDYLSYRKAVTGSEGLSSPLGATDLNRRLAAERLRRGRGLDRAADRRLWPAGIDDLPTGAVIVDGDLPQLVLDDRLLSFGFAGWHSPVPRPRGREAAVLTPPTSVAALAFGFAPVLHPTASE